MKKIVMATAAIAMAASAFAVDISAAIKMNGSLFDMTCAKGAKPSLFKLDQPKAQKGHGQTGIDVTVSGDKAGATLVIGNGYSGNANLAYQDFKLWVKPLDMLKIELGSVDYNLNKESIDYAGCINGTTGQGYGFVLTPVDGLEIDAVLPSGYGKTWITDGTNVGKAALLVKYNANEAGKFGLSAVYNGDETASYSVGYSNTIGKVSLFADAALDMTAVKGADEVGGIKVGRITSIKADAYAKFADGDFSVAGYAGYELKGVQELKLMSELDKIFPVSNKAEIYSEAQVLSAKMRVDYKVGALGLYLYVADSDFIGHENAFDKDGNPTAKSTIKPGVTFNIGSAAFDVAVDVTSVNKGPATISVPCSVAVNF